VLMRAPALVQDGIRPQPRAPMLVQHLLDPPHVKFQVSGVKMAKLQGRAAFLLVPETWHLKPET
jgi:hypothetical protein